MKVSWLEQTQADLPRERATGVPPVLEHGQDGHGTGPELEWLNPRELAQFSALRFPKRRADWLLGRWTAKRAVAACLNLPDDIRSLAEIELRPAPSGAPEVFLHNKWAPAAISLSHRAGRAICAVAPSPGALGCDLEAVEPRSEAFIADYFATQEQALIARVAPADRPWLLALLWSAKESALKALGAGLRLDTRCVIVTPGEMMSSQEEVDAVQEADPESQNVPVRQPVAVHVWHPLRVHHLNDRTFLGWWQHSGDLVRTIAAVPPPARPHLLTISSSASAPPVTAGDQPQAA